MVVMVWWWWCAGDGGVVVLLMIVVVTVAFSCYALFIAIFLFFSGMTRCCVRSLKFFIEQVLPVYIREFLH